MNDKTTNQSREKITTKERKIGKTTFIISTSFNDKKERNISEIIARLIEIELAA